MYIFIKSIFVVIVFVLYTSLTGCTSIRVDSTIRDPYLAGLGDIVSTEVALASGAVEMNPLGPGGAYLFKGIYLFVIRPGLSTQDRIKGDRMATSLWWGATINNVLQVVMPGMAVVGMGIGIMSGVSIYQYQRDNEPDGR